jgi:hypothetical protein
MNRNPIIFSLHDIPAYTSLPVPAGKFGMELFQGPLGFRIDTHLLIEHGTP